MLKTYYWPIVEASNETKGDLLKMPFVDVLDLKESLSDHKDAQGFFTWFTTGQNTEHGVSYSSSGGGNDPFTYGKGVNHNSKPIKWSDWEITSAFEYDQYWLPKMGDSDWNKYAVARVV